MKVLFVGGTGNISRSCVRAALRAGMDVWVFNRGSSRPGGAPLPRGVSHILGDIADRESMTRSLRGHQFDAVAQFIAYTPDQVQADIDTFAGSTSQYLFISSASAYHKPPQSHLITESTPLSNPFWEYSRNKIACELVLAKANGEFGFPATVVRPSHTYGEGWIPTSFGSRDFTVPQRILDGKEIVVHGDGTSLWTLTHADDFARGFVGLLGNPRAIGEAFHITSDEVLTWNQIHEYLGMALDKEPRIVHLPSEVIAEHFPERGGGLLGDKAHSAIFDNTKIRAAVPGFLAAIPYHMGVRRSLSWLAKHPEAKQIDQATDSEIDSLVKLARRMRRS